MSSAVCQVLLWGKEVAVMVKTHKLIDDRDGERRDTDVDTTDTDGEASETG
jgi:hypothetical protein